MYYWVNQGKTYKEEKAGGYLWAPIKNSTGNSFFHWDLRIFYARRKMNRLTPI